MYELLLSVIMLKLKHCLRSFSATRGS